jgi:hypothetical protein
MTAALIRIKLRNFPAANLGLRIAVLTEADAA